MALRKQKLKCLACGSYGPGGDVSESLVAMWVTWAWQKAIWMLGARGSDPIFWGCGGVGESLNPAPLAGTIGSPAYGLQFWEN